MVIIEGVWFGGHYFEANFGSLGIKILLPQNIRFPREREGLSNFSRTSNQSKSGLYSFDQSSYKRKPFKQWCCHTLVVSFCFKRAHQKRTKIIPRKRNTVVFQGK